MKHGVAEPQQNGRILMAAKRHKKTQKWRGEFHEPAVVNRRDHMLSRIKSAQLTAFNKRVKGPDGNESMKKKLLNQYLRRAEEIRFIVEVHVFRRQ
jgi:hypothetical protein